MACYRDESSPNPSKRCSKCLSSTLKDAFANCHGLCCKFSTSRLETEEEEEEALTSDYDEDEEFVSAVISKYLESKLRQKMSLTSSENFCCDFSPAAGDLFIPAKAIMQQKLQGNNGEEREEFVSVGSHFSHSSSSTSGSMEAFVSAKTSFSRCSSLSRIDFPDFWRPGSNILQFTQCEGWPFGLCRRRALLLPPPPKSPSDSWKWRKTAGFIKLH
ncbi:PREDICTED: uncharacterized protein LOC109149590 [Ipomoea nil]|uniref:uncharacterized protein LOC109149590 n=1 Tax=Ipomoea nil TaxID=35883 RepID=UPI000901CF6A|nr:PREDICTED: uncharacterized protein LOC109149590 [Ipomoea nil]